MLIQTERLSIRRICFEDWKAVRSIWAEVAGTRYAQYDRPHPTDDAAVMKRIETWSSFADSTEHMFYAVCLADAVIGYFALHQRETAFEIGYCFHPDFHGKGYAKESLAALLDMLKARGYSCVIARAAMKNGPSVGLLHSLQFRQIGSEKVSFYQDEQGRDVFFDGGIFERLL